MAFGGWYLTVRRFFFGIRCGAETLANEPRVFYRSVDLQHNGIQGSIPSTITSLVALTYVVHCLRLRLPPACNRAADLNL